jgi:hypothetical protein
MLKRYLIIFTAVALSVSTTGFAQSPERPTPEKIERQRQEASSRDGASQFSLPVRILEEPDEAMDAKRQQQEGVQREKEDLIAQQSMARSTEEIVLWTRLQFLLALAGTGALLYTLRLNRKATNAAVAAAEAAYGVERAWMSFHMHILKTIDNQWTDDGLVNLGKHFELSLVWRNEGRSPALNCNSRMVWQIVDAADFVPKFHRDTSEEGAIIGPGRDFSSPPVYFTPEQLAAIVRCEQFLFIYGAVTYNDFFSRERRHSEVCFRAMVYSTAPPNQPVIPKISLIPAGDQNTAT